MPRSHKNVEILISKLEQKMREVKLWSNVQPSAKAMQSTVPFAYDVMPFEHWLQFVFIPKMSTIINSQTDFPSKLALLPMAEQSFTQDKNTAGVIAVIQQIDLAFSDL
jgi:uncharacterized protein YqcC (DUF446 family)